jgi:hypothetical protein
VPIPLTGPQFNAIVTAAAILFPADRDAFVAAVAAELARMPVGDGQRRARCVASPARLSAWLTR